MNYKNMFLQRLYKQGSKKPKSQEPARPTNKEDNGTDINAIEKYYIELSRIYDYNEKNDVQQFFDEICTIAIDMYIESTIKKGGVVDHMNVVDVPTAQVDKFKSICKNYNIHFTAV